MIKMHAAKKRAHNNEVLIRYSLCLIITVSILIPAYPALSEPLYFTWSQNGNMDIWSINADGSEIQQITSTPYDETEISLSPDRSRIIFSCSDSYIKIMELKSKTVVDSFSTDTSFLFNSQAVFYNGGILFTNVVDKVHDVSAIAFYANNEISTIVSQLASVFFPTPLPESKSFVYTYFLSKANKKSLITELWIYNGDNGESRQLTMLGSLITNPKPLDSHHIIFASNSSGTTHIYTLDLTTGTVCRIIATESHDLDPTPSADGRKIAFITLSKGKTVINIFNRSNKNISPITTVNGIFKDLAW